jgi:DNA-binding NarL/FixJ family response regulator
VQAGPAIIKRTRPIRVLLADRHSLVREAMHTALDIEPDLEVVADAADAADALVQAGQTTPDVVVLDASMFQQSSANGGGLSIGRLRELSPESRIVVVTEAEDEDTLVEAVEAGATGFVTKGAPLPELLEAIRAVGRDEAVIPGHLLGGLLRRLVRHQSLQREARHRLQRLTRREREVLALLSQGANNQEIAEALVISPQTARTHTQNILSKLGVHSRLEAVAFVSQHRVLPELVGTAP